MDMLTGILDSIFSNLAAGGWFIAMFAILVGCFSIANIMFVSVRERTKIIGVQKAIGAKNAFILIQFLFEAVTLCVFGALLALVAIQTSGDGGECCRRGHDVAIETDARVDCVGRGGHLWLGCRRGPRPTGRQLASL